MEKVKDNLAKAIHLILSRLTTKGKKTENCDKVLGDILNLLNEAYVDLERLMREEE